ncbi:MAG: amidase [Caulobacteraceae bacterium]|nr:amidase [Caulobacteraceae bacterium]
MNSITRRGLLASAPVLAAGAAPAAVMARSVQAKAAHPDAVGLAQMIRKRQISALEAVDLAIGRAEALQPKLNFLVTPMFERARARAKAGGQTGPFAGVPFLVKDLNDVKGVPTRYGSRVNLKNPAAESQEPYIDAFEKAGLIFIGKSATPEYGFLPTTEPVAFGPTHNPWNLARSSGGSSGGSAAAVAAGVVPFAHANDGGGSIRIPSANCGLFGLKPSRGRMIPGRPSSRALDIAVEHCVTRSVRDSATLFAATEQTQAGAPLAPVGLVAGPDKRRLKVGLIVVTLTGGPPDPEVRVATEEAAKLLEALGHHVEPARWPVDGVRFGQDFTTLWASGAAALVDGVAKHIGRRPDETMLEPFTLAMADLVRQLPPGGLDKAVANLKADSAAYDRWFDAYDVIVSPVLGKPPVELGYVAPTVDMPTLIERLTGYVGYTTLHNVAGAPAMSVPLHWTPDGLPVGVQFAARAGQERTLFQLAYELERARPWAGRHPPLWAA